MAGYVVDQVADGEKGMQKIRDDNWDILLLDIMLPGKDGIKILKTLAQLGIESEIFLEKMRLLDHARKKTTQKVNLYEKVQIPGYQEAILTTGSGLSGWSSQEDSFSGLGCSCRGLLLQFRCLY